MGVSGYTRVGNLKFTGSEGLENSIETVEGDALDFNAIIRDESWDNFKFECGSVEFPGDRSSEFGAIIFRYTDSQNFYALTFYRSVWNDVITIRLKDSNISPNNDTSQIESYMFDSGVSIDSLRIDGYGCSIKVWVNDVLVIGVIEEEHESGSIGFACGNVFHSNIIFRCSEVFWSGEPDKVNVLRFPEDVDKFAEWENDKDIVDAFIVNDIQKQLVKVEEKIFEGIGSLWEEDGEDLIKPKDEKKIDIDVISSYTIDETGSSGINFFESGYGVVALEWEKETFTLDSNDVMNEYVELAKEPLKNSAIVIINGVIQNEGEELDYTVDEKKIEFSDWEENDIVVVQYQYQLSEE